MLKVLKSASLFLGLEKVPSYGFKKVNTIYTVALYTMFCKMLFQFYFANKGLTYMGGSPLSALLNHKKL